MDNLVQMKCSACRGDEPAITETEAAGLKPLILDWQIIYKDSIPRLERVFAFKDFACALMFTNKIGALAEEEGHHPAILTEWGKVTVTLWTHKIKGLHHNDFIMAAKIDALIVNSD